MIASLPGQVVEFVFAIWAGVAVGYLLRSRQQTVERTRAHLDAVEKLHQIAALLGIQARPPDEVLRQMMDATCGLLNVPKAFVCRLETDEANREMIRLIYHTGFQDTPPDWTTRSMESTPAMAHTMRTREPLYVADIRRDSRPISDVLKMERYRIRAIMMFPLLAGPEVIGVMVLADSVPRKFSDAERRLGRLWASQCAVTLVTQRLAFESARAIAEQQKLNEQVERDAQAKELLLSELNHRVKNNMTRIVGLLSAESPALSVEAHQWLDRAISRIATLARAHELFVGSQQSVDLMDLIVKALQPVHALLPRDARLQISGRVNGPIGPDQAVTIAMVINELANNALEHGIGPAGVLRIVVSRIEPDHVRIELADDGSRQRVLASGETEDRGDRLHQRRTGMGLKIVRGLVGRELHGSFSMTMSDGSGAVAAFQFPVEAETCE